MCVCVQISICVHLYLLYACRDLYIHLKNTLKKPFVMCKFKETPQYICREEVFVKL